MADEFDLIDGDLAELDVDWERVLGSAGPLGTTTGGSRQSTDVHQPISPGARSNATSSFGFGDDDIDASFLAELDRVEQDVVARSNNAGSSVRPADGPQPTSSHSALGGDLHVFVQTNQTETSFLLGPNIAPGAQSSRYFQPDQTSVEARTPTNRKRKAGSEEPEITSPTLSKKLRHDVPSTLLSPKRKGKMKDEGSLECILSTYEDELCCPIAAAHIGTPCGHTFCGDCGWQWYKKSPTGGCPCCREKLDESNPIIPNIAMDNVIEKHIKALALSGKEDWSTTGQTYHDWVARKEAWKRGAAQRARKKRPLPTRRPAAVFAVEVFHPPAHWQIRDDVEIDPTYEDDDEIEMLPRPPPRTRSRRRSDHAP
ncbi:hypothetical protein BJ165DRAFT_1399267 [Panaeolus papilionaceus]|nr:hypothetical protein BJ165DRAFT_1399267 [Panaeolus papilionaceus]